MPRVEFVGQSVQDSDNIAANPSRLLNFYRERVGEGGRTGFVLRSVLGQELKENVGDPIRAMGRGNDKNWAVGGGSLFEVASDGTTTSRGSVADDAETTIAGNYGVTTVVSGGNYYAWDGATLTQPTTKTFTTVGSHCYVGGYTVITEDAGRRFQWSALGDAETLDALHFASADKVDDDILRAVEYRGNLLLMCETSTEIWQISGVTVNAFTHVNVMNRGLKSFNLLTRFDDALFYVGNDNRAHVMDMGPISTPAVETSIKQNDPTHCFFYEDEGHQFLVIRFSDRPAWVFDMATGEWHERSEGAGHLRWRAIASLRNGPTWLVGNTAGDILELTRSNTDLSAPLYRRAISRTVYLGDRKFTIPKVEIVGRVGATTILGTGDFGLSVGDGFGLLVDGTFILLLESATGAERAASITLKESGSGGQTWRTPKSRSMGLMGDYEQRMIWRSRGQFQQYTMCLDLNEPADLTLYADAFVTAA